MTTYSTPEDERIAKPKLKADVQGPQRTIPGRIEQNPKPIPAGQRNTGDPTMPRPKPSGSMIRRAPEKITQKRVGGAVSAVTRARLQPNFGGGKRSTPEDEDNPKRKAILKRLRMRQNAEQ